ncbi:GntR family transcriptional regulator [Aureimonas fodinaquatilis]|uniref:GntR family transcriptional regulator n=1 Tax=Aureimonas fodinaquatilis TaxID=2565783 RepID=A0A5B0DSK4_9HYPH|nr:GntR family transcriptional regulator [Aureimonas fodinaquatilis]KAA0969794.1 GntR family transcriptional regulator [Aureimonas fodinaquatilis]
MSNADTAPTPEGSKQAEADTRALAVTNWPDLTAAAYERIEELFVSMALAPGSKLRTQDLQVKLGLGRTPVHQAVRRLAAGTLLQIQPRNGLRVPTIDLSRERRLVSVRRDLNRFVTEAAVGNLSANHRATLSFLKRRLIGERDRLTLDGFNEIDKALDILLLHASGEPFLESALRPLHAMARRIGYLHISQIGGRAGLERTINKHLDIIESVLHGDKAQACRTSDQLVDFGMSMIDELEETIDPALLDAEGSFRPTFGI